MTIIVSYYQPHKAAATLQMDWRLLPFVTVTHTHTMKNIHTRTHTQTDTNRHVLTAKRMYSVIHKT